MARLVQETRYHLSKREAVAIDDAREHLLRCESGELWITLDGDRRDIILAAGDSLSTRGRVLVAISALQPSTLVVTHPTAAPPCRFGAEAALALLRRWRFPPLAAFSSARIG